MFTDSLASVDWWIQQFVSTHSENVVSWQCLADSTWLWFHCWEHTLYQRYVHHVTFAVCHLGHTSVTVHCLVAFCSSVLYNECLAVHCELQLWYPLIVTTCSDLQWLCERCLWCAACSQLVVHSTHFSLQAFRLPTWSHYYSTAATLPVLEQWLMLV